MSVIPGSTSEFNVQVSNVSLTADAGDKRTAVDLSPQHHHKGHRHVKNSNAEGSTIMSVIHPKNKTTTKTDNVVSDVAIQHYFNVLEGYVIYLLK